MLKHASTKENQRVELQENQASVRVSGQLLRSTVAAAVALWKWVNGQ